MNWPAERDLPEGRHRLLKEFVMTEIDKKQPKRGWLRPLVLAPALVGAAAVAVAVPLLFGGAPAYAVTDNPDGTIQVQINEVRNPEALEVTLREHGANVVVDYVPQGKKCGPEPRSERFLSKEEAPLTVFPPPEPGEPGFTIDPSVIKEGQTGVLEFTVIEVEGAGTVAGVWARVADGPVADCELFDTTDAPLSH
ncbi:hypothetical protein [Nonomuraea sp. NPDC048916]|uniref:hypothetical protein n=1 Tax=Nonomuraea sp. NPDC048916 TaxID=3154232 RepID=UPI0033E7A309